MANAIIRPLFTIFFTAFTAVFSERAFAQHPEAAGEMLEWNEFYTLGWDDFRGEATATSIGDAGAVVQIKAKPYYVGKKLHYNVTAYFNRSKSWARDTSASLLRHERLHFDIAELYARRIRKMIEELSRQGVRDPQDYNAAIRELLDESDETDREYDLQTLHGALQRQQREWEQDIARQLRGLDMFKKKKRVISPTRNTP